MKSGSIYEESIDLPEEPDGGETEQDLYEHHRIVVDKGQALLRIDKYLMHRIPNASRTKLQYAADGGCILVNEKGVKSSYRVKPGDLVSIVLPHPPKDTEIYPEQIPLDIIYEDDHLLIVNKQAGMVVHPGHNNVSGTLVNALAWHLKDNVFHKEQNIRPGLVHRIDKNTSGLLVIAKDEWSMTHLARQFFEHTIQRRYQALVWGDPEQDTGTVTGYIGRSLKDRRVFQLYDSEEKGKWSVTHYSVIERFRYVTLIECRLETGRTHQIRVHMKSAGHPLFGDETYGGDRIIKGPNHQRYRQFVDNCLALCPRQALHARSLGFVHPVTKKEMYFEAELPTDMGELLNKWRGYHEHVVSKTDETTG